MSATLQAEEFSRYFDAKLVYGACLRLRARVRNLSKHVHLEIWPSEWGAIRCSHAQSVIYHICVCMCVCSAWTMVDTVSGRQYPIDVLYTSEPQDDYLDAAMISCLQIHLEAPVRLGSSSHACFLYVLCLMSFVSLRQPSYVCLLSSSLCACM
jgi:hypothetical protein